MMCANSRVIIVVDHQNMLDKSFAQDNYNDRILQYAVENAARKFLLLSPKIPDFV